MIKTFSIDKSLLTPQITSLINDYINNNKELSVVNCNEINALDIGKIINIDLVDFTCKIDINEFIVLNDDYHYVISFSNTNNDKLLATLVLCENGDIYEPLNDIKDYKYSTISTTPSENEFPETYTVKYLGNEIKNQGSISCCAACTLATINEAWQQKIYNSNIKFSEGWNYGSLRKDRTYSKGMLSKQAIEYSTTIGMIDKDKYDITSEMPNAYDEVHSFEKLFDLAKEYKLSSYYAVDTRSRKTGGLKDLQIKEALMKYDVPLYAICPKKFGTSHAICLVGWDDNNDSYIVKNSWGSTYGTNGIGKVSKDEFNEVYVLLHDEFNLKFTDVQSSDWFYKDVKKVYLRGLMNGINDTTFDPNSPVTRAQLAVTLNRLADLISEQNTIMKELIEFKIENNKYK